MLIFRESIDIERERRDFEEEEEDDLNKGESHTTTVPRLFYLAYTQTNTGT